MSLNPNGKEKKDN